jgi:hypothetical protein
MIEGELVIRPKLPDIAMGAPFVEGLHPYTMMFLYLAYQEGAHRFLADDLQRNLLDLYYTGNLTISRQENPLGRKNLEAELIDGFKRLRGAVSKDVDQAFKPSMLPYFKEEDMTYLTDIKGEKKKRLKD